MMHQLDVRTSEETGLAYVVVPHEMVWGLVEYLSYQRAQVCYSYEMDGFKACFLRADRNAAQRLLDHWEEAEHAALLHGAQRAALAISDQQAEATIGAPW